jgi:ShK domain-like
MNALAVLLVLLATARADDGFVVSTGMTIKEHADCDLWATRDGECLNNPGYMWTKCHSSCIEHARDLQPRCREWAEEGECTANPGYIHNNCPEACGYAVAWSPFVRRTLGIDRLPFVHALSTDACPPARDVFSAAATMRQRLRAVIFFGGASSVPGLTFDAPSEYLGMLGLAEVRLLLPLFICRWWLVLLLTSSVVTRRFCTRCVSTASRSTRCIPLLLSAVCSFRYLLLTDWPLLQAEHRIVEHFRAHHDPPAAADAQTTMADIQKARCFVLSLLLQ